MIRGWRRRWTRNWDYVITLNNGGRVMAAEKPHLEGFSFISADLNGRTNSIPSTCVRAIEPASDRTLAP